MSYKTVKIFFALFVVTSWCSLAHSAPANPVLISPLTAITEPTPEFVWQDQSDATQYRVYVYDRFLKQKVVLRNYSKADVCSNGLCSITPDHAFGFSKNHRWFLKARNADGFSDWSRVYFNYFDNPPAIITTVSPTAVVDTATPVFKWLPIAGAVQYRLYVRDVAARNTIHLKSYLASDVCTSSGCEVSPTALTLPQSDNMLFRVRGYSTGGWGPWSVPRRFSLAVANEVPVANNDSATGVQGSSVEINVLSNDADSDGTLDVGSVSVTQPSSGSAVVDSGGKVTYTHDGGNSLTDSFTYTVKDNNSAVSNIATIVITVLDNGINQPPQTANESVTVAEGGQVSIDVLANDTDVDGTIDINSIDIYQPDGSVYLPANGTVQILSDGRISYQHYGGPTTTDTFYYVVADNDGAQSDPAMVTLVIGDQTENARPQANNDSATVSTGGSATIEILRNDTDADGTLAPGTVVVSQPSHGQLQVQNDGSVIYTHNSDSATVDSFSYTVADDLGLVSNNASVTIAIVSNNVNQAPVAVDESVQLLSGASISINVLANDSDVDGTLDPGAVTIVNGPVSASSFSVLSDGSISYVNNADSRANDTFSYTVKDNDGAVSNVATVSITLLPVVDGGSLNAFHRDGQTFLTWVETGSNDEYHVYRHSAPVTTGNLSSAVKLTSKWGPLGSDTSVNFHGGPNVPRNFVIADLANALDDTTGLFVYTTQQGDSESAYYAVTSLDGTGTEQINAVITSESALTESVATPSDVLTVSVNDGKGRIYTQYMDYLNWNPTFNGYAYNYTVALPANYNSAKAYPLMLELHAYYEVFKFVSESQYDWQVITVLPHDPGPQVGALHSWWYGYSRDHNYLTDGDVPGAGPIANFTEQRIMRSIDEVISNPSFNVDENLVHAYGNSMGASGSFSLGLRYGSVLSGVYANEPMTNYQSSPTFESELVQLWGTKDANLPIINSGPHSEAIQLYGLNGVQSVGVWDWMNHHKQMINRRGDDFAFLMTFHGKQDRIIDWATQGRPTVQAFTDANMGFSAVNGGSTGHTWTAFTSVNTSLFGFGYDDDFPWKYPRNLSFPAIQNASGSSAVTPSNSGDDAYNMNIEWATPHTPFAANIVDLPNRYEISLRSASASQVVDMTPRRTRQFDPTPGSQCSWTTTSNDSGQVTGSGTTTVDNDSLVIVAGAGITAGTGTLIAISCP